MAQKPTEVVYKSDIKIIVVGLSGTGKTSFVQRWIRNVFSNVYKATIVSEYGGKTVQRNADKFHIQMWDIAGQDKNVAATKIFIKDSLGCIVCADASDKKTFEDALKWKRMIDDLIQFHDKRPLPNMLLANKCDLLSEAEKNDTSDLENFARKNNFDCCFKTSAKEGINIEKAMDTFIDTVLQRLDEFSKVNEGKEVYKSGKTVVELEKKYQTPPMMSKNKNDNCC